MKSSLHLNPCLFEDVEICVCPEGNVGGFILIYRWALVTFANTLIGYQINYVMNRISICDDRVIGSNAFSALISGTRGVNCGEIFVS